MNARRFSLEHLIRLSISYGLVTDYRQSPKSVQLFRDEEALLDADPEEARIYLQGLITGHLAGASEEKIRSGILPGFSRRGTGT